MNRHDAARANESIINQRTVFHGRTIEAWIYGSAIQKAMTAKSREAGWQLQKSGVLFGFGCKLGAALSLRFSADLAAKYFKGIAFKQ